MEIGFLSIVKIKSLAIFLYSRIDTAWLSRIRLRRPGSLLGSQCLQLHRLQQKKQLLGQRGKEELLLSEDAPRYCASLSRTEPGSHLPLETCPLVGDCLRHPASLKEIRAGC